MFIFDTMISNGQDLILSYEDSNGKEIKIKKVFLSSTEHIWYVFNEELSKWTRTKHDRLLLEYLNQVSFTRNVIFEKFIKKKITKFDFEFEEEYEDEHEGVIEIVEEEELEFNENLLDELDDDDSIELEEDFSYCEDNPVSGFYIEINE